MTDPFRVVRDFEAALCEYTGAPYAVTTNSCTMALLLAVHWHLRWPNEGGKKYIDLDVEIPRRTYCSVPMSIIHAGGRPTFRDEDWRGAYRLKPLPVWDSARKFTSDMWHRIDGQAIIESGIGPGEKAPPMPMVCVSFHHSKILGDSQGGAILHNDAAADKWLRRARFDGRTEGVNPKDDDIMLGWHCYLSPDVAARLLWKLSKLPLHNEDLPADNYPDLSTMEIFK